MSLQFSVGLPQGGMMELASIKDPVEAYEAMTRAHNPYGDGHASERIVAAIQRHLDS